MAPSCKWSRSLSTSYFDSRSQEHMGLRNVFGFLVSALIGAAFAGDVPRQDGERCPSGTIGESEAV
jgi:hypothetical protein